MAPINSQEAAFLMLWARLRWQSASQEGLLDFSRSISFFGRPQRFYLPLLLISRAGWRHWYYITKVGHWRKDGLEGHAPFCFPFFLQKIFVRLISLFYLVYLHLKPREKYFFSIQWIAWSWYNIIQRSNVSCILFPWLRGDVWGTRSYQPAKKSKFESCPGNLVCLSFSLSFYLFFSSSSFLRLVFFHDQSHTLTQTRGVRREAERPKGREQFASLDLWITD